MVADGGEDVAQRTILGCGIADAVGSEQRKMQIASNLNRNVVPCFFLAMQVALQFDVNIVMSKDAGEPVHRAPGFNRPSFF